MLSPASCNGFQQIIDEPTHTKQQSSSCIDFMSTVQPNLSVNSGAHPSVHSNCHHQIVHSKPDLSVFYLLPYQRLVRNYRKADVYIIRKALDLVNWDMQVLIFNETILTVFRKFVPSKTITNNDEGTIWINEKIKSKIKSKSELYKIYIKNGKNKIDF